MSDAALNVRLGAKTKEFNAKMMKASRTVKKFGQSMSKMGASLTRNVTMPIVMLGAASIKMSLDFQKSMTKIQTLVGKTESEIESMKSGIMDMSMETAKAPVELAEGLYFLESAGLRGANAMETLEQVAKGSASGLGDMEALSVVAAAAQNAYGEETLSASEALDKFGVMVRTGMFDAQELSNVLGRQLGLASNLGIGFDEVGALISTYTQTTGDATAATNGLSAIMMTFAKLESEPTKKQAEALDKIKMSAEDVKTMMGEKGLMATMQHLQTQFEANGIPMADFFTKSQALKGALGVLGSQTEAYTSNLDAMGDSAGFVSDAFSVTAETDAFKMEQAMASLQVAGTQLGDSLAPVVEMISEKVMALTQWWTGLDKATQDNYASWAIWIATVGPVLMIVGGIITKVGMFIGFMKQFAIISKIAAAAQWLFNVALTANPIGVIIMLVAGLIAAIVYFATSSSEVAVKVRNGFKWMANGVIKAINWVIEKVNSVGEYVGLTIPAIKEFEMESTAGFDKSADSVENNSDKVKDLATDLNKLPGQKKVNVDLSTTGGGDSGDDTDTKKAEEANKRSLEKIRKLKQQFNVLNETDKQKAALISLKNQRTNALLEVKDSAHSEAEKLAINKKFDKKKEILLAKQVEDNKDAAKNIKSEWEKQLEGIEGLWDEVLNVVGQVLGSISGLLDAQADKQQTILDNKQAKETEDYEMWLALELEKIETSSMNDEQKEEAKADLDKRAAEKKTTLDKKMAEEQKALAQKQAKRDKAMNIFNAIISTASGVVKALGSAPPPANFVLAGIVGALGAAQVAAIASTPIPMADGGIAFGPTNALIGEYAGASTNPEVVAPLNKLKSMLGSDTRKIEVFGRLDGNDIFLSNESAVANRLRFT